jgi:ATP-dependent Clp protease protease subunit
VWLDPHAEWTSRLYERLLARRIVMASGLLDDDAASRLSAQLLTLDAEQEDPIRLELQNLRAELPATLTVMGILDVLRVPVHACVSGEISGPALGVLASCPHRSGYPNAMFVLAEPRLHLGGTVTAVSTGEQQMTRMLDTLYFRLADVTGREGGRDPRGRAPWPDPHHRSGHRLRSYPEAGNNAPLTGSRRPAATGISRALPALTRAVSSTAKALGTGREATSLRSRHWSGMLRELPSVHTRSQSVTFNRGLPRLDRKV